MIEQNYRGLSNVKDSLKYSDEEKILESSGRYLNLHNFRSFLDISSRYLYLPRIPSLFNPGWLKSYLLGPFDKIWMENIISDIWAGTIVAIIFVPQVIFFNIGLNYPFTV